MRFYIIVAAICEYSRLCIIIKYIYTSVFVFHYGCNRFRHVFEGVVRRIAPPPKKKTVS